MSDFENWENNSFYTVYDLLADSYNESLVPAEFFDEAFALIQRGTNASPDEVNAFLRVCEEYTAAVVHGDAYSVGEFLLNHLQI